jgi:hypothetical protein
MAMDEETDRNNKAVGLGSLLQTQLEKLGERRKSIPVEETAPLAENVRYLPAIPAPAPLSKPVPATAEEIIAELMILDVIYPFPTFTTEERSLRYRVFCSDLGHYPIELIRAASKNYRNGNFKYFPTPGQLRDAMPVGERWEIDLQDVG